MRLQLAALFDGDIAMHFAEDGDGFGFDFAFDFGVFADGKCASGGDFAFDFSVNHQFVLKLDGAFDFDVAAEDVLSVCGDFGHGCLCVVEVEFLHRRTPTTCGSMDSRRGVSTPWANETK